MATAVKAAPEQTEREKLVAERQKEADATNKTRSGKGTRIRVGQTRGKNPQVITWEAFDDSLPDTLPASTDEFLTLTGTEDEKVIVGYLIAGYNDSQYTAASDPVAEFVEATWSDDAKNRFRIAVRNYAAGVGVSIEEAAELIKPGFVKAQSK